MSAPPEGSRELAQVLLAHEGGQNASAEGLANACIRVINQLHRHLSTYIGNRGFAAILGRALHLAQEEYPFLGSLEVGSLPDNDPLPGLHAVVDGRDAASAREGVLAILANIVGLMETFFGRDLAEKLINEAWRGGPGC